MLLEEQFSCWIRDADDKLGVLRHYGFAIGPGGVRVTEEPSNVTLTPNGIGIRRDQVQLFLSRHEFEPVIISMLTSHTKRLSGPTDGVRLVEGLGLLRDLFAWIGSYERWVIDTFGAGYRSGILEMPADAASKRSERWWSLAQRVRGALHQTPRCSGRPLAPRVTLVLS